MEQRPAEEQQAESVKTAPKAPPSATHEQGAPWESDHAESPIPASAYEEFRESSQPSSSQVPARDTTPDESASGQAHAHHEESREIPPRESDVKPVLPGKIGLTDLTDTETWYQLLQTIGMNGIAPSLLWNCLVEKIEADQIHLLLDETQSALYSADQNNALTSLLTQKLAGDCKVKVTVTAVTAETPAARRRREKAEAIAALENRFQADPGVMGLLARFDASIEEMRIEK